VSAKEFADFMLKQNRDAISLRHELRVAAERHFDTQYRMEWQGPKGEPMGFKIRHPEHREIEYTVTITDNLCPDCLWPPALDGLCACAHEAST
jgi:hypothetical protein